MLNHLNLASAFKVIKKSHAKTELYVTKKVGGDKNGGERNVLKRKQVSFISYSRLVYPDTSAARIFFGTGGSGKFPEPKKAYENKVFAAKTSGATGVCADVCVPVI